MTSERFLLLLLTLFLGFGNVHLQADAQEATATPKGIVKISRSIELSASDLLGCNFAGTIVLGGPSTLHNDGATFKISSKMLVGMNLIVDYINKFNCGIRLSSGNYAIELRTFDDQSSKDRIRDIANKIIPNVRNDINTVIGGYSSGLTEILAEVASQYNRLVLSAGAAATSVFEGRNTVFGTLPPSAKYPSEAIKGLAQAGAKTVATVFEEAKFTKGVCGSIPDIANMNGIEATSAHEVSSNPSISELEVVAMKLAREDPDAVVSCVYAEACAKWINAMRNINWSPKAQIFTVCVGLQELSEELGPDVEYLIGISPWDPSLKSTDALTGWSAREFAEVFTAFTSDNDVTYHPASAAAVISIAVQAMEKVDTTNETELVPFIANNEFQTMFGNVAFDVNGQNFAPSLATQYDLNGTVQTVFPVESSSGSFLYPMPTWVQRDCIHLSRCTSDGNSCNEDGECICTNLVDYSSIGVGESASCILKEARSSMLALSIALPIASLLIICVVAVLIYERKRNQNDSVWEVNPDELQFGEPPVVIGRGSFGVVLMAEYRGTQFAVKRVIPPKKAGTRKGDSGGVTSETAPGNTSGAYSKSQKMAKSTANNIGSSSWANISFGGSGSASIPLGTSDIKDSKVKHSRSRATNSAIRRTLRKEFKEEMRHLSKLRHPCITTIMGAVIGNGVEPMLVMEYMEHGSLHDLIHNETMVLEGDLLLNILRDISQGVRFLHSATPQVIHGDLKAANILVDRRFRCKVADFGLSQKKNLGGTGTPFWMAPELLRKESPNTAATDVYSFGIILYEIFSRRNPYEGEDAREVLRLVADKAVCKRPTLPPNCPPTISSLMADCLVDGAEKRPSFNEIDLRLKETHENFDVDPRTLRTVSQRASAISPLAVFPKHIAQALKDGRVVEPERKDVVTILYCSIIGLSTLSATMHPSKVADLLDRVYTKFDDLSRKHDVFNVETVGDSYMAVANLVKDQESDHAKRIANFAMDAVKSANETYIDLEDHDMGFAKIRVGVHSGPVIADVVGSRNPRYCLLGDSVKMTSEMESNSKENRILCSDTAADILAYQCPEYMLDVRRGVTIKGKGEMRTFWVYED